MKNPPTYLSAQLLRITGPFLLAVLAVLILATVSIRVMSSARTYIVGESVWSKDQKDAIFYAEVYAETASEEAYKQYISSADNLRKLRSVRLELARGAPDAAFARTTLIDSGIAAEDVSDVIWVSRIFRHTRYFNEAMSYWSRGDVELERLDEIMQTLREQLQSRAEVTSVTDSLKRRIWQINADIRPLASKFSDVICTAFRRTATLLMATDLYASILLMFLSTFHVRRSISERKKIEIALLKSEARAKATLGSIGEAVIVTGASGYVEFINAAAERISGRSAADCAGKRLQETLRLVHEGNREPVNLVSNRFAERDEVGMAADMLLLRGDGKEIFVQAVTSPICDTGSGSDTNGYVLILRNMTREREYRENLAWQALHDALTGLVNRAEFERRLSVALQTPREDPLAKETSALLFLDLDRFRVVNDTCGHAAGDSMLREVAKRFQQCLRANDTLARFGGDEFGVLLQDYCSADIERVTEELRTCLNEFVFMWDAQPCTTSVSVGVLKIVDIDNGMTVEQALRLVDVACYIAKERGRNRVQMADLYDSELLHYVDEASWGRRVKQAMEADEFCLYVQPIVEINEADTLGNPRGYHAELLLRMNARSSGGGVVAPGLFIRAAERYGLMPAIDRWVIRTALERLSRIETPYFAQYGINLSGTSIGDERFLDFVREQFARTGVAPSLICFEITETAAIANLTSAVRFMRELTKMGCRFALDDFGAGMSSFGYLKQLPVEYLKIDGSFVRDINHDPVSCDIVAAINDMGHAMKCKTIAEYVGSAEVLEALRRLGVDCAQGYYLGQPAPWIEAEVSTQEV
ncbi:EAL domain-containing protein [Paraburkholderia sp. MMS20-SJTR3]|uniref:EAL domain-containing protein n=1 Tax=Paraburkholderia sejongensis TaxID=2886946 RepID=A0ABS8K4G5_9BURK|nr:EAL domain-containing protein [Paraburkholderia sp. MMS20-SJTR3]MCC8396804.1 EAL domain-containing protein [Paraburkholderia sp. MMS20-SJTR3]